MGNSCTCINEDQKDKEEFGTNSVTGEKDRIHFIAKKEAYSSANS